MASMARNRFSSRADVLYRIIVRNTFFGQGWGTLDTYRNIQRLKRELFNADTFKNMVSLGASTVEIDKAYDVKSKQDTYSVIDGHFVSPLVNYFPGLLPKESEVARFQAVVPLNHSGNRLPMCVQLAGTGDHHFWRRRNLVAKPLVKEKSIGSVMLVNPYYGCRKPKTQTRSSLNCVVDLFVMGCALIAETSVLLNWCERQGYGPLGVTGVSLGGHMASLAGTFVPKPIAIIPCLSWTTASTVFTEGVLSNAVAWSVLEKQLEDLDFFEELLHICHMVKEDAVNARKTSDMANNNSSSEQHLSHVSNDAATFAQQTHQEFHVNFSSNDCMSENIDQSLSLTMLAGSVKEKLENDFKQHAWKDIPHLKSKPTLNKSKKYEKAHKLMEYILDIMTHLAYYKEPFDPQLAVFVQARYDSYIPRKDCPSALELWPGCEVKYTECGHIVAALYKQDVFRKNIVKALNKIPS